MYFLPRNKLFVCSKKVLKSSTSPKQSFGLDVFNQQQEEAVTTDHKQVVIEREQHVPLQRSAPLGVPTPPL